MPADEAVDYDLLTSIFKYYGWKWKVGKTEKIPDALDLEQAVNKMREALKGHDESQISMGHLVVQKYGKHIDVYAHVGSHVAEEE